MRVMVTGAGGMLGEDLLAALEAAGHEPVALDRGALDIRDPQAVDEAVEAHRPECVVNCAAWTDVDGAESDRDGAFALNETAAANVAAAAARVGASVVYPSTDYVFAGSKRTGYVESDPTDPQSVYGASKLAGEVATAAANPRHWIVRTAWLFGTGGRNFVETMLSLAQTRPEVNVVDDQVGCPTATRHLARAIVELIEGEDHGVHHLAASGHCSWYDFAVAIFDRANTGTTVSRASSEAFARPAPRPAYSVLVSERERPVVLPDWREGLADYLGERSPA